MQLYAILGYPVSHTLSPAMQQAAFRALKLRASYVPLNVPPARLGAAVRLLRGLGVAGFNVTVPHKERIAPYLDRLDVTARAIGAVNTVVRRGQQLVGYNTDAAGLLTALTQAHHLRVRGARVLVVGAGGAARAVVWALARGGARSVALTNRTSARAALLRRWSHQQLPRLPVTVISWAQRARWCAAAQPTLIINATALGLHAQDAWPLDSAAVPAHAGVYDLVYRRPVTRWVAALRRRGRLAFDGRSMLLYQGAQAVTLWTGRRAPVAVMRRALERRLR